MNSIIRIKNKQSFDDSLALSVVVETVARYTTNFDKAIDQPCFFEQLRLEKHRALRSRSALSLLLLTQINTDGENFAGISELLKTVQSKMRETDIAGYIDQHTLGALLPYTDDKGAKKLGEKIMDSFSSPQFSVIAATYPDDIFDSLVNKSCVPRML